MKKSMFAVTCISSAAGLFNFKNKHDHDLSL